MSAGAIAVVAEDMTVFLALFLLWRWGYQAILRTVARDRWPACRGASRRVVARCAAVLHAVALYSLAVFMLVFVAVEHMFFWSTGWAMLLVNPHRRVYSPFRRLVWCLRSLHDVLPSTAAYSIIQLYG